MKTIFGYDSQDARDFGVRVSDKVYDAMKRYLVQYHLRHPQEVEFLDDWGEEEE